ncbi:MAG: hypothetical protein DMF87_08420 [Acidobacteria bacterium]|nr:MAG: hypothetical protein DMF87_08420 [Acidobacteriota bacterium]
MLRIHLEVVEPPLPHTQRAVLVEIVDVANAPALVNGVMAHSDETDDSHGPSQSHPGASVVPAALAVGEDVGATGEHYLRAVTLGYDVGTRLTMALDAQ